MRRITACIIYIFISVTTFSQSLGDSILKVLSNQNLSATERLDIYTHLITEANNKQQLLQYGRGLLSAPGNDVPQQAAIGNFFIGLAYQFNDNPDSSVYYYDKTVELYGELKDYSRVAAAQRNTGIVLQQSGRQNKAVMYFKQAINNYESVGDKSSVAACLDDIGMTCIADERYEPALQYYWQALKIRRQINDSTGIALSYNNISKVKYNQQKWQQSLAFLLQSVKLVTILPDAKLRASVFSDAGATYLALKQYDSATWFLEKSISLREANRDSGQLALSYNYNGTVLQETGNLSGAAASFEKALSIAQNRNDQKQVAQCYQYLAGLYGAKKDFAAAYQYQHLYKNLDDSLAKADKGKKLAALQVEFETEQRERQLKEQQLTHAKRNFITGGIIILVLFVLLLVYAAYRRTRLKQAALLQSEIIKQQDIATKAVIAAEENERKRIAGDLHDGVGQMMSAVKMNLSGLADKLHFNNEGENELFNKTLSLVDESCREVRTVSHNMMPNALLKSGLGLAVKEFIDKIDNNAIKIHLHAEGLNDRLDSNIETVLYRIIQEAVNNVIRHANANHLDISLIKDNDGISATIEDNGKGFDTSQIERFNGIGLRNIIKRVEYLKGSVDFDSHEGKGTLVAIHVPFVKRTINK